jgi:hypothetical protein
MLSLPIKIFSMNFTFFSRPEIRKFNYKPQFYVPEDEKPVNYDKYDSEKFAKKLHNSWDKRRHNKNNPTANMRIVIWLIVLLLILGLLGWKFMF